MARLLDLFCGGGGAAMGYHRAGFDTIVGVDIVPQPSYPFDLSGFDLIHASPPCQAYIRSGMVAKDGRHPMLVEPTRELLLGAGVPFVIENVPGAPMRADVVLCGSHFGLGVRRHRWFEFREPIPVLLPQCDHSAPITGVYGHPHGKGGAWRKGDKPMLPSTLPVWQREMGIDWLDASEITQAIPPAYTEWIGHQLLNAH